MDPPAGIWLSVIKVRVYSVTNWHVVNAGAKVEFISVPGYMYTPWY